MAHPSQQTNVSRVAELLGWLRGCENWADYNEFQRHLFGDLYKVEQRRAECSRMIKRLRAGNGQPQDPPEPPHQGDPAELGSWQFEALVFERLARQLRAVGDGLAWTCFGYDRRMILTLSRNSSPGPMYDKKGLPFELGRIDQLWKDEGHFGLLHDLTNCLRIADITEFTADGGGLLREVKASGRVDSAQMARIQAAIDAITRGGVLPGQHTDARLVELAEPYATSLTGLGDLLQLARLHGCRGMKLLPGRALVASSVVRMNELWGASPDDGLRAWQSVRLRAMKRAQIVDVEHHVLGNSGDTASRSPIMAPFAIYPFPPDDCAALICDLLIFETILAPEALVAELSKIGLTSEVMLPREHGNLSGDQSVLQVRWRDRGLTLHTQGLNLLLYELVDLGTWARGVREVLTKDGAPGEPVVIFAGEASSWAS